MTGKYVTHMLRPLMFSLVVALAGCAGGGGGHPGPRGGTGGEDPGAGGSTPGSGGATPGGGGSSGSGGSTPGSGGSTPGTGGSTPGSGGSTPGTGGAPADARPADTAESARADAAPADAAPTSPPGALTAGWTEKPFTFALHTPYDLPESDRHSFDAATNTHTFWVIRGDKPHEPPPNTTGARSELRMNNDYKSGNHQFEADVFVVSGTNGASVMQVFGGVTNATSIMLFAYPDNGGSVKRYNGPELIKAMIYDKWWHLNVIHEANGGGIGKIRVYADGQLAGTFDDRGNATHYFKCGVYNNSGQRAESRFRNIKYWVK
jgi:hypothetical protein